MGVLIQNGMGDKTEFYRTGNATIAESNAKFHNLMDDGKITMPDLREEMIELYRQEQADNITAMNDQMINMRMI